MQLRIARLIALCLLAVAIPQIEAAPPESPSSEQLRYFETHVRPLLIEKCFKCHNDQKQSGQLRVDSREGLLLGVSRDRLWSSSIWKTARSWRL